MPAANRQLLIIDDDVFFGRTVSHALTDIQVTVRSAHTGAAGLRECQSELPDIILLDQKLPDIDGNALCESLAACCEGAKIIFITAFPSLENAVQAVKLGAYDYLTKPFEIDELRLSITRALHTLDLEHLAQVQRFQRKREGDRTQVVGADAGLKSIMRLVNLAADNSTPVLITGETGTGKTLVAKSIHHRGRLSSQPFIGVNCAAIPESLMEAEFFGHMKGAFTGAVSSTQGLFEMAEGGTLFLDEIGEVPSRVQAKLLGVLDDHHIRRVGGRRFQPVNVRIIAATNADLVREVQQRRFREDLFYRLGVFHIHLPPLRERLEDIEALSRFFISRITPDPSVYLGSGQVEVLQAYSWPGNVRELRNVIERAILLRRGPEVLPAGLLNQNGAPRVSMANADSLPGNFQSLREVEWAHIRRAMYRFQHNRTHAARALGISRSTLIRKLQAMKPAASDSKSDIVSF